MEKSFLSYLILAALRFYQVVSMATPRRCRFYPRCSSYAQEAIALHGARRGAGLTLRRVSRCHPFHSGGFDPVPQV